MQFFFKKAIDNGDIGGYNVNHRAGRCCSKERQESLSEGVIEDSE